jgi:predicted DNA-binding transcriptional regulator AlpA
VLFINSILRAQGRIHVPVKTHQLRAKLLGTASPDIAAPDPSPSASFNAGHRQGALAPPPLSKKTEKRLLEQVLHPLAWQHQSEGMPGLARGPPQLQLIRRPIVLQLTGLSPSAIDDLVWRRVFPQPVKLAPHGRAVGWVLSEVQDYIAARIAERDIRVAEEIAAGAPA